MKRVTLALADRLRRPIAALGIEYPQFRLLLETKLELDGRRPQPLQAQGVDASQGRGRRMRGVTVFFYLFVGGTTAMLAGVLPPLAGMTFFHGMLTAMLGLTLLSEFNGVIHDPADDAVLRPLPIGERTVLAARLAHAGAFLAWNALYLSAGSLLIGVLRQKPLYVPALLLSVAENALFVVALAYLVFLGVMRFTSARRFRDIVNVLQITLSVVFSASYLVLPRLIDQFFDMDRLLEDPGSFETPAWLLALPAAWFGAARRWRSVRSRGRSSFRRWLASCCRCSAWWSCSACSLRRIAVRSSLPVPPARSARCARHGPAPSTGWRRACCRSGSLRRSRCSRRWSRATVRSGCACFHRSR